MNAAAKPVVYPNPFSQNVSIQIPGIKDEQYTFTVYDITGKLIHHENVYINGDQKITRDFGFIQNGVYIIQLKSENQVFQTRIVKH
jgi:hypothetical protein